MYLLRSYITYFNIIPSYKLFRFIYLLYNYFLSSLNRNTCCTLYISHLNIIGRAEQFVKIFIMYFFYLSNTSFQLYQILQNVLVLFNGFQTFMSD